MAVREKGMRKKILFELMLTFMKIGLFTFGGGYAMIGTRLWKKKQLNPILLIALSAVMGILAYGI